MRIGTKNTHWLYVTEKRLRIIDLMEFFHRKFVHNV